MLVLVLTTVGAVGTFAAHYRLAQRFQVGLIVTILLGPLHVQLVDGHYIVARAGLFPLLLWYKTIVVLHNPVFCYVRLRAVAPRRSSS